MHDQYILIAVWPEPLPTDNTWLVCEVTDSCVVAVSNHSEIAISREHIIGDVVLGSLLQNAPSSRFVVVERPNAAPIDSLFNVDRLDNVDTYAACTREIDLPSGQATQSDVRLRAALERLVDVPRVLALHVAPGETAAFLQAIGAQHGDGLELTEGIPIVEMPTMLSGHVCAQLVSGEWLISKFKR